MAVILLGTALIAVGFFVRVHAAAQPSRIAAIGAAFGNPPRDNRAKFEGSVLLGDQFPSGKE